MQKMRYRKAHQNGGSDGLSLEEVAPARLKREWQFEFDDVIVSFQHMYMNGQSHMNNSDMECANRFFVFCMTRVGI